MKYTVEKELRWHDMYVPSFIKIVSGIQVILRLLPRLRGCSVGITNG
jgi:hypothetical protein